LVWCCANIQEFITDILDKLPGSRSFRTLKADSDGTGTIEDRNIACHGAEDNNARLGHAAATIVDDEVIRTSKAQCSSRESLLPRGRRQR
jgi:hypothetical protein